MWENIEEVEDFENIAAAYETIKLLRLIKQILYDVHKHQYLPVEMYNTLHDFIMARQGQRKMVQT